MPTKPDPNSPFLPSRLEATFGIKAPGTPSISGTPTPQAADLSYPAPPAPATAPVGRPPTSTATPTIPGMPTPLQSPTPQPAGTPLPPPPPRAGMVGAPTTPPAATTSATAPAAGAPVIGALPRQPSASELPAGAAIETPMGTASRDATGAQTVALSPAGQQQFREAVVKKREELGPIPGVMRHPSLPEMPVELGKWNFSPFTGRWVK